MGSSPAAADVLAPVNGAANARRRTVIVCAVALVLITAVGMALGLIVDSLNPVPQSALQRSFDVLPAASARVRSYTALRWSLYWSAMAWFLAGLVLAVRWGQADWVLRKLPWAQRSYWRAAMAIWAGLATFLAVWRLPVVLISTAIERAYGLSTITPMLWLADRLRDLALDIAWAPGVAVAWWLIRRSPSRWWLILASLLAPVGFLLTVVYPVFIDPLYNRFRTLENGELRTRIMEMAAQAGVHDPAVLVADHSKRTRKANAYVTGLGPTHRIVLWDTTLARMTDDEVLAITAHELGHYRLGHIWTGLMLHTTGGFVILYALALFFGKLMPSRREGEHGPYLADPRAIPAAYLALSLLLLVQTPIASAISRVMERQADAFGLRLSRDGEAAARALASFSRDDLADPDPNPWMVAWTYSHPPLRERVARAIAHGAGEAAHKER